MKDLKGTKTEKNLYEAFAGESMARNKYTYFASVAKKEGYEQIAGIFLETSDNEKEHAKLHFKALKGIGTTLENLIAAAEGEHYETKEMYPRMAATARDENFEDIAIMFEAIGSVEKDHEKRYRKLLDNVEKKIVFKNAKKVYWKCRNCGHIHEGSEAPDSCPVCKHPKAFFELFVENY
ncbi:MAG: rubrerythrin family protein [bacterium (Candidatus Stahlbacteria) CG23_combo_of_CG06-09_8_20_14_all_34_7]|nr:MAG: rubrerythrin family protein [bacterium (Candidatus Stahlbacteria) CG23_combo_of_CG06-09_8_20_14_all_34_7]